MPTKGLLQSSYYFILCCTVHAMLLSCNGNSLAKEPCRFGEPTPLFSSNTEGISRYTFDKDGQNATESLFLKDMYKIPLDTLGNAISIPAKLEILQSGCNEVEQEFRIEFMDKSVGMQMPHDIAASECAYHVTIFFQILGNLDKKAISFYSLADAIGEKMESFRFNEPIALQDGFTAQIDKIHSPESTMITVVLKQTIQ